MSALGSLVTFSAGLILRSEHNANWAALRTWADNSVVHTDVIKSITVGHSWVAAQTFAGGVVLSGGSEVTANITFSAGTPTFNVLPTFALGTNITGGGSPASLTAANSLRWGGGGSNPIAATGAFGDGSGWELRLGPVVAGVFTQKFRFFDTGALTIAGTTTITAGGLTVSAGGAAITGNSTITGNLTVTGTFSAPGVVTATALASDATTTSVTPANTALVVALGSNQTWRIDFDMSIQCDNTGGVVLNFTAPAGATCQGTWIGNTSSHTAVYGRATNSFASVQTWNTFNSTASANGVMVRASLYVTTTATSGNLTLQISSGVAGQTSKLLSGSTTLSTRIT